MTDGVRKQEQWQRLIDAILGNQETWIIDIGLKTGLFAAIARAGDRGVDEDTLADQLGYQVRYVRVWCRAAYAFALLDWDEGAGYRLAPHMDTLLLDPTDPQFLGGRIQFYTALYEDFRAFPDTLKTGRIWPRSAHDPWLLEALKNLTKPDAVVFASTVLPQAPETLARLEAGGDILEIGSGGGHALVTFAQRFPASHVVGIELDSLSVALAQRTIEEAGLAAQIELRQADANELTDSAAYDLVMMNIVLHETGGPGEYHNVLRRCWQALRPGGTVLVSELPYPDSPAVYRSTPAYRMLAGVQLHEAQVGCGAITQNELWALVEEAGFVHPRVAEQPIPTRFVMLAERGA
jgi:SAM-dependent methyltransferase